MKGGQLEIMKQPKHVATELLINDQVQEADLLRVSYGESGKCIAVQGSQLAHHVTRVQSAKEDRISFIISFQPANVYHPERCIFDTMKER